MATRKTSSKSSSKTSKSKAAKAEPVVIPPWPGIEESVLQDLAVKLDRAKDSYRVSDMIRKVNGDEWGTRHAIAWHLVACRAIHPETNPHLLGFLEDELDEPSPEVLMDLLVRLPDGSSKRYFSQSSMVMDGYSLTINKMLFQTYVRAPEVVKARENELNTSIRLGLAFVRRRLGETIAPETSAAILQQLAKHQTTGYGLTSNHEMPVMEEGELVSPRLGDLAAVKKLALLFGTEKEWDDAMLAGALTGQWQQPKEVRDVFFQASTAQLAKLVDRSGIDTGEALRLLLEVIPQRNDEPAALLEAALTVTEEECMREMLLMGVIYRSAKIGAPIPEAFDELLSFELLDTTYEGVRPSVVEWFKFFPRDRALAGARKYLKEDYKYSRAVGILAAHFDEEILREALEKDVGKNYISAKTVGALGAQALPLLEWAYGRAEGEGVTRAHRAVLQALVTAAETSEIEERWERYIDFDEEGGKPIQYYSSSDQKPREAVLQGIPEPRRSALLLKLLEKTQHPYRILAAVQPGADPRVVDTVLRKIVENRTLENGFREHIDRLGEPAAQALCNHIGLSQGDGQFMQSLKNQLRDEMYQRIEAALEKAGVRKETACDALVRKTSTAPGLKTRVYVLQVERDGYEPKEGTIARSGGKAPGVADADVPKDKSGEPLTHLFTLDLNEIPELQEKYSGARGLAVFCPEPNSGDRSDELELVPVTGDAIALVPNNGGDDDDEEGRPIAIVPLDVPLAVFERSKEDGVAKEIRKIIFNAAGHVLGEPFWIQDDEGGADDFIMQINEGLCDVNLGDCGSLYVFDGGTVFQCY